MKLNNSKGMALITAIVALVIVGILVYFVMKTYTASFPKREDGTPDLQSPIDRGKGVQCLAQRKRVETAVKMYSVQNGVLPSSLSEVSGLTDKDLRCPITGNPFSYNSKSGRVTCPDHY